MGFTSTSIHFCNARMRFFISFFISSRLAPSLRPFKKYANSSFLSVGVVLAVVDVVDVANVVDVVDVANIADVADIANVANVA